MKIAISLVSLVATLAAAAPAARAIDPAHSHAQFSVSHIWVERVTGTVPILSGSVTLAEGSVIPTDVTAVLDPAAGRAGAYGLESIVIDGQDADVVYRTARAACDKARSGGGPSLIECRTYRFRAHSMFDPQLYRDRAEVEEWKHRDPIDRLASWMRETGALHDSDLAAIEAQVGTEIEQSVAFAERGHWEPVAELARDVYAGEGVP